MIFPMSLYVVQGDQLNMTVFTGTLEKVTNCSV